MAIKTPYDILEAQRAENTKAYAHRISALQAEVNILESKKDNLQKTLDENLSLKRKELNELEMDLKRKMVGADNAMAKSAVLMNEAVLKNKQADEELARLNSLREEYK